MTQQWCSSRLLLSYVGAIFRIWKTCFLCKVTPLEFENHACLPPTHLPFCKASKPNKSIHPHGCQCPYNPQSCCREPSTHSANRSGYTGTLEEMLSARREDPCTCTTCAYTICPTTGQEDISCKHHMGGETDQFACGVDHLPYCRLV